MCLLDHCEIFCEGSEIENETFWSQNDMPLFLLVLIAHF